LDKRQFLRQISLEQIIKNQTPEGAIIAGPTFSQYNYSWFRDGAFIAYAMIRAGKMEEAEKFISWGNEIILNSSEKIIALQDKLESSSPLVVQDFLGARYTAQGKDDESDWPNFQIDGYGTWLWCMSEYLSVSDSENISSLWRRGVELTVRYLKMVWQLPNSDCWEEFPDKTHPATLACVYGGLKAVSAWFDDPELPGLTEEIKVYVYANLHKDGYFPKFMGSDLVDASLLWVSLPFQMADVDDPVMKKTVEKIEEELLEEGGVKRYSEDTYYGGGQWIIHSCWLAWYYYETGRYKEAEILIDWVVCRQKKDGSLPEQTTDITNEPSKIKEWEQRWGTVATPLTWSHAMFLIVDQVSQLYTEKKGVLSYEN
jgi:GH15 family glucan-1,4-alpha-glucosidase